MIIWSRLWILLYKHDKLIVPVLKFAGSVSKYALNFEDRLYRSLMLHNNNIVSELILLKSVNARNCKQNRKNNLQSNQKLKFWISPLKILKYLGAYKMLN